MKGLTIHRQWLRQSIGEGVTRCDEVNVGEVSLKGPSIYANCNLQPYD